MKRGYALPLLETKEARRCTAPSHFLFPNSRHCLDLYLPVGTPICAVEDGVVVARESRYNTGSLKMARDKGNVVCIRHADGRKSLYAHLLWRSVIVRIGESVLRGQVVAQSADTGYASYPHLHFGLFDPDGRNIPAVFSRTLPPKVSWKRYSR